MFQTNLSLAISEIKGYGSVNDEVSQLWFSALDLSKKASELTESLDNQINALEDTTN